MIRPLPTGLGVFYASRAMKTPAVSARKAAECRAQWAAVLIESVDGRQQKRQTIRDCVDALAAHCVTPVLYTFPRADRAADAIEWLSIAADFCNVDRTVVDLEPYQGEDWTQERVNFIPPGCALTLFPRPQWQKIQWGGSNNEVVLQVYQTVADRRLLSRAIKPWQERNFRVIPAVGAYLGGPAKLAGDLYTARQEIGSGDVAIWSLDTTDTVERRVLAKL